MDSGGVSRLDRRSFHHDNPLRRLGAMALELPCISETTAAGAKRLEDAPAQVGPPQEDSIRLVI
jgi:hypothetical protein